MHIQSIDSLAAQVAQMPNDEAQHYLKAQNISIVTAIRITHRAYGFSADDAKKAVALHPAWNAEATGGAKLHDELLQNLP